MYLIPPWTLDRPRFDRVQRNPHSSVTLEPRPECHLPNPVTLLDPPLSLTVRQLVPHRARRRVPEPVKCHSRRLHVPILEFEALLHAIQHSPTSCVDTKMLERELEVRHVGLDLRLQHLPLY